MGNICFTADPSGAINNVQFMNRFVGVNNHACGK